ncbi:MAG: zinc-dependent alcohol dehydrogenase family protein [Bacillota bacterium]
MKMKAAVFHKPGEMEITETNIEQPAAGQVLIQVKATGICGTDRHIFHGKAAADYPLILGHEIAGEVIETGSGIEQLTAGDRVAVDPNITCGKCFYCRRGEINLCKNLQAVGVTRNGGFAQYVLVPVENVYQLPESIGYQTGSMIEPISCCLRGLDRANIESGELVFILGAGAIGLILAQLAAGAGARRVLISEPNRSKRELARRLGLETVVPEELEQTLAGISAEGADTVIEAVGIGDTVKESFRVVRRGGTIVLFGVCPEDLEIPMKPFQVFNSELTIKGSFLNPFVVSRSIELLAEERITVKELITDTYSLEELPGVLAADDSADSVKSLVVFE